MWRLPTVNLVLVVVLLPTTQRCSSCCWWAAIGAGAQAAAVKESGGGDKQESGKGHDRGGQYVGPTCQVHSQTAMQVAYHKK